MNVLGESMVQEVNLLTVIAFESYEKFAASLQEDMKEDLRDRPSKVDSEFFARLRIPADKLGTGHVGDDPSPSLLRKPKKSLFTCSRQI